MAAAQVKQVGDRIEIGSTVRVEAGPPRRRRKATDELMATTEIAARYRVGSPDSLGHIIEKDKLFSFLDVEAQPVFYVFKRRDLEPDDHRYQPAAEPDENSPPLNDDSTNIRAFTYVYDEIEGSPFATQDEAIERGQAAAAE